VKTASKSKTKKSTKKTARKAAARNTGAKKPASRLSAGQKQALTKASRAQLSLLENLEGLGLLNRTSVEKLEQKAEALTEASDSGLAHVANWSRALGGSLAEFEAAGGDPKQAYRALVTWQNQVVEMPDTRDGIASALKSLKKVIPYDGATLFVRKPDEERVDPLVSVGFEVQLISRIRFAEGLGFSSWVAARKQPVLYSSLHRNEAPGEHQVRSFISAPLVVGGECLGVVNLGHADEEAYNQGSLRMLILAAGFLAALVDRSLTRERIAGLRIQDPSTGLATATYFRRRLDEEVVRCRELGHSMSLIAIRINELDQFTDHFGEEFRQRSLVDLADLIRKWRNPTELAGLGPDGTFLVLLPAARAERVQERAAALQNAVAGHNFPRRKRMTLGVGAGTYPTDAEDPQALLESVDKALYEAGQPRGGGGEVCQPIAV